METTLETSGEEFETPSDRSFSLLNSESSKIKHKLGEIEIKYLRPFGDKVRIWD